MKIPLGSATLLVGAVIGYLTGVNSLGQAGQAVAGGHWTSWVINAKSNFALYSIGHFRQQGALPPSQATKFYTRLVDDDGASLRGACSYELSGMEPAARWWSISAGAPNSSTFDATFTARDAVLTGDGQLNLAISRRASPGNWLALKDRGALLLTLVLNEPYPAGKESKFELPALKRLGCE